MSRDAGYKVADVDVNYLDDAKFRRLSRSVNDEGVLARCIVAHQSVVLASWQAGERVALVDSAPLWLTGLDALLGHLVAAGLLCEDGMLPVKSWECWFGPAGKRRDERVLEGTISGLVSHGMPRAEAVVEANRRLRRGVVEVTSGSAGPVRPSVPTDPSVPPVNSRAPAREEVLASPRPRRGESPHSAPVLRMMEYEQRASTKPIGEAIADTGAPLPDWLQARAVQ